METAKLKSSWLRIFCAVGVFLLACPSLVGGTYFWKGEDGDWSDPSKWTRNGDGAGYPSATNDIVRLTPGGPTTINIDGDYEIGVLTLNAGTAGNPDTVTITGSGSLKIVGENPGLATTSSFIVFANRKLVLAGADITAMHNQYVHGNSEIVVKTGAVLRPHYIYVHTVGSRITVDGGQILTLPDGSGTVFVQNEWNAADAGNVGFFDMKSGYVHTALIIKSGTFTMTGGVLELRNVTQNMLYPYSAASFTGGEIRMLNLTKDYPITHRGVFPQGARLVLGSNAILSNLVSNDPDPVLRLDGGEVYSASKFIASEDFSVIGGGNLIFGGGMSLSPNADDPISNVVFDVDSITLGANLARPYDYNTGLGNTIGTNLYMRFPRPVVLAATNANWFVSGYLTRMRFDKMLTIDTTDRADGVTPRTITLRRPSFADGARLRTAGCGEALLTMWPEQYGRLAELTVGGTSTLGFEMDWSRWIVADSLAIAPGATLKLPLRSYLPMEADTVTFGEGSRILLSGSGATSAFQQVLVAGPESVEAIDSGTKPEVVLPDSSTWTNEFVNGSLVVWKQSDVPYSTTFACNRWTGAQNGVFGTGGNWSGGAAPSTTNETAVFDGIANTRVTVPDEGVSLYSLRFLDTAGPFILDGGKIKVESRSGTGASSTIYSKSPFPVIIRNDMERQFTGGNHAMIALNGAGWGYISMEGTVNGYARFDVKGDVRVRGDLTAWNIRFYTSESSKPTRLTIYRGGSLTASNQTLSHEGPIGGIIVKEGGSFTVKGTGSSNFYGYTANGWQSPSVVDGTVDIQSPLGGTVGHWYSGSGRVKMLDTGSKATADYTIRLGGSVKFSAKTFVKPIVVEDTPTLCAVNDWTYSAGALDIPEKSVFTIDTTDPETSAAHACTFASPISGAGVLKVKGAGTLALAAANNVSGGLVLDGGTLSWSASQTFGSISGTGTLDFGDGSNVSALTVTGDADLSGILIPLSGAFKAAMGGSGWTTLLTVPDGASITGVPADDGESPVKMRVAETETGLALQVRLRPGTAVIFR